MSAIFDYSSHLACRDLGAAQSSNNDRALRRQQHIHVDLPDQQRLWRASVKYGYDGVALSGCTTTPPSLTDPYPVGRRTAMCDGSGATSWSHDKMGRPATVERTISGFTRSTTYQYNLDGSVSLNTTFSNKQAQYTYAPQGSNSSAGRVISMYDPSGSPAFYFVNNAIYTPNGALARAVYGSSGSTPITETGIFNNRLQPCWFYATTGTPLDPTNTSCSGSASPGNVLDLKFNFGSGTNDNGDVYGVVNNRDGNRSQNFLYDPLNRIWQAYTNGPNWGETYSPNAYAPGTVFSSSNAGIDPWGNLTNRSGVTGKNNTESPLNCAPASTQNRLPTCFPNGYDAAGNLIKNGTVTYTYDAENRLIATSGYTYTYDGDGNRAQKVSGTTGTIYWRDAGGEVQTESNLSNTTLHRYVFFAGRRIARTDAQPTWSAHFYFSDHLGSSNVVTDANGNIENESDFYPYGGERVITNSVPHNYKFTGKERDAESGLDMFGARYYGSSLGRFMQIDPKQFSIRTLANPQKWNKYAYVLNNPLALVDPNGMEEVTITYRTFIPTASVTVLGKTNGGDNRWFSTASNASSRTSITIKLETDPHIRPGNPIISVESHAGPSTTIKNGQVVETKQTTEGLPTATGTRDANGTAVINIQQDTKNPLSPGPEALTPGISANLNVTVYQDASATQVNGTAAQFPASELNETRADGTTTPVIQYMPPTDATPWSLMKPDRDVNDKKETPACKGGDSGCP